MDFIQYVYQYYHPKAEYDCFVLSSYCYLSLCKTPIDIDECALGIAGCDVNANCSNTEGSYECTCFQGYTGSGMDCSGRWLF